MSAFYCRHKILERFLDGEHRCVDCNQSFDIVKAGTISVKPTDVPPQQVDDSAGYGKWWFPIIKWIGGFTGGGAALGLVASLGGAMLDRGENTTVTEKTIERQICEPQIVEVPKIVEKIKEVPIEKIVYKESDKICPDVKPECPQIQPAICPEAPKPEIVYVPQKANCSAEIKAACDQYRKGLDFFLKKQKNSDNTEADEEFSLEDEWDAPID